MPDMDLGDVTIHYEEDGAGPLAYVYCHSLSGNGGSFVEEFDFWLLAPETSLPVGPPAPS